MKTYTSNSEISLSVRVGDNKHTHIRFNPTSNGGSSYSTNNPVIQKGLERHPQFGKMFHLSSVNKEVKKEIEKKSPEKVNDKKVVKVNSIQDAKDYLVDTFGISRTQLTSKAKILANAESHNIEFNGLD